MMNKLTWVAAILSAASVSNAFSVLPQQGAVFRSRTLSPLSGMAQPEVQIKTTTKQLVKEKQSVKQKNKAETGDPISRREEKFEEAPMFKLMLLADDGYDVEHVVTRLTTVVDDMDDDQAATVLEQAQLSGKAMCGIYPFERAELFKEQLQRSTPMIFSDLEEEN